MTQSADDLLKGGDVPGAFALLKERVRANPAAAGERVFLFQLLCILGDWERALVQLNTAGELDASTLLMVQAYREVLQAEALRASVFRGERAPLVFGEPEHWLGLLLHAAQLAAEGKYDKADAVRDEAFETAPATSGRINGEPFEWIADADTRLGPCLEVIVEGRYYWLPFAQLKSVEIDEPGDLRDLAWLPATLTFANGGQVVAFIPTRYSGSEAIQDGAIRLARRTDWETHSDGTVTGLGQRMLATDSGEYPLLEVRSLVLDTAQEAPGSS
jgi:type VI secretion system protein ImpE